MCVTVPSINVKRQTWNPIIRNNKHGIMNTNPENFQSLKEENLHAVFYKQSESLEVNSM